MRKYKTARFLARFVIIGGLAGAVLMTLFAVTQLLTPIGMLVFGRAIGAAFLGVLFALVGYGFIAVFDIAETLTGQAGEASNYSLKRTDQSLRDLCCRLAQTLGAGRVMAYEEDKREFQRITARSAVLRDRGFFSLGSSVVVFLLSKLADSFGYNWLMVLLFLGAVGLVLVGLYFVLQEKRLRWRYYNLHYRVQAEHEKAERGGFIGRDRKW